MSAIPLSQSYRIERTLAARPDVLGLMKRYEAWCREAAAWDPHGDGTLHVGRSYDVALTLAQVEFAGRDVLELGARGSFLCPYVTDVARSVVVTDLFGDSFRGMGTLDEWAERWIGVAKVPDRLTCRVSDMRALDYDDDSFDVVVAISAIEHLVNPPDADVLAAREMGRVCRPGGFVVIGTDMAASFRRFRGYYYDEDALQRRLIGPSGCELWATPPADLSWEQADKSPHRDGGFGRSACLFVLRKPE